MSSQDIDWNEIFSTSDSSEPENGGKNCRVIINNLTKNATSNNKKIKNIENLNVIPKGNTHFVKKKLMSFYEIVMKKRSNKIYVDNELVPIQNDSIPFPNVYKWNPDFNGLCTEVCSFRKHDHIYKSLQPKERFESRFSNLFKSPEHLPPPEPFNECPKTYPSERRYQPEVTLKGTNDKRQDVKRQDEKKQPCELDSLSLMLVDTVLERIKSDPKGLQAKKNGSAISRNKPKQSNIPIPINNTNFSPQKIRVMRLSI